MRDAIRRHGDALRRFDSTVVSEVVQEETVTGSTEILRNPNYGHSLTVIYYQILRHLKVTTEFAGARECLFVPFAIKPFNLQRTYRWRESIERYIRSIRFGRALKYLRDVATDFQFSDLQPGTRSNQQLTYLRGSITIQLAVERPADKDGKFDAVAWQVLSPMLGMPALGIWSRLSGQLEAQRDALFQREHAPTIAAKWANRLILKAAGGDLRADCTLATRYGFNQSVRVDFMIPADHAASISRATLLNMTVEAGSALPPGSVANVIRMSLSYGTRNFERSIEGVSGVSDMVAPGTGTADKAQVTFPLDAWDHVDERLQMRHAVNELIEHLNEHVEYYQKAILWSMDRDRLLMLLDGFYVPGTDKVSIASVVDREPVAIIGNSLVYRVSPAFYIGYGKVNSPKALYDLYANDGPQTDPLLISLPTDGLYAQTIMDECLALEEHRGSIDWVLDDPDPELGTIEPFLLASRRADVSATVTPTTLPSTIINLQNAPDAPAPSGLQGAFNAITNPNAFRDMAGLAATQANAAAAFQAAASLATNFGNQAAALKLAELASKAKATDDANKKLAAVQKAQSQELISNEDAADHANKVLNEMHDSEGNELGKSSLQDIAQQLVDKGQEGSVAESSSAGVRVIDIKAPEFQADDSTEAPIITFNSNVGQSTNGRAVIFNFGTFIETNRFKTFARQRGFLDTDVMFNADPGGLVRPKGVELIQDTGLDPVFSLYPVNGTVWNSKLDPSQTYRASFKKWVDAALQDEIDCLYLTGHHWTTTKMFILSSGESTSTFSLIGESGKSTVSIGRGSRVVEFDIAPLRNRCKLLFGYGCDVATKTASAIYQSVFGRGAGDVPVVCGWDASIDLPSRAQASLSPNARYFEFLEDFAIANSAPADGRLQWFYDKHPKVRAWLAERARFHVHYTPTYASWLNQVERWFAILTSREIRRGSFASAKDLVARITAFVAAYNTRSQPFTWTATADDTLAKLARLCNVISGTLH